MASVKIPEETAAQLFTRLGAKHYLHALNSPLFQDLQDGQIQSGDVVELFGDEGTAKTEMLLNILTSCIQTQCVIFIDTDCHFPMLRLVQIIEYHLFSSDSQDISADNREKRIKDCLSRLYYFRCHSSIELVATLESLHAMLARKPEICCLMIDSISAFYWQDKLILGETPNSQEYHQRKVVDAIKDLIASYSLAVFATRGMFVGASGRNRDDPTCSFLSSQWQKLVRYRFMLTREGAKQTGQLVAVNCESKTRACLWSNDEIWIYKAWLISSRQPCVVRKFLIDETGVKFV
jgi:DNA-repair protein XRCC2